MSVSEVKKALLQRANKHRIEALGKFYKTYKGGYGEGDAFIGVSHTPQREIAKQFSKISLKEVEELLQEPIHEYRSVALQIMVKRYKPKRSTEKEQVIDMYLRNIDYVNNWDLVDMSAPHLLGVHLWGNDDSLLVDLAHHENIWHQRIAIVATQYFIKQGDYESTFKIAKILLNTPEDIIQKAVGWMLKEIGKKEQDALTPFLDKHYKDMPRTILRYSLEKVDSDMRKYYMKK